MLGLTILQGKGQCFGGGGMRGRWGGVDDTHNRDEEHS